MLVFALRRLTEELQSQEEFVDQTRMQFAQYEL
jgi:hypothetical protein